MYGHSPGLTADLAIFHVALIVAASWINADGVHLAAVRTGDVGAGVGGAVTERKIAIEVELLGVVVIARAV